MRFEYSCSSRTANHFWPRAWYWPGVSGIKLWYRADCLSHTTPRPGARHLFAVNDQPACPAFPRSVFYLRTCPFFSRALSDEVASTAPAHHLLSPTPPFVRRSRENQRAAIWCPPLFARRFEVVTLHHRCQTPGPQIPQGLVLPPNFFRVSCHLLSPTSPLFVGAGGTNAQGHNVLASRLHLRPKIASDDPSTSFS